MACDCASPMHVVTSEVTSLDLLIMTYYDSLHLIALRIMLDYFFVSNLGHSLNVFFSHPMQLHVESRE